MHLNVGHLKFGYFRVHTVYSLNSVLWTVYSILYFWNGKCKHLCVMTFMSLLYLVYPSNTKSVVLGTEGFFWIIQTWAELQYYYITTLLVTKKHIHITPYIFYERIFDGLQFALSKIFLNKRLITFVAH